MISFRGSTVFATCDRCADAVVQLLAPPELAETVEMCLRINGVRFAFGSAAVPAEDGEAVAGTLTGIVFEVLECLPAGWTVARVNDWPRLTCRGCNQVGAVVDPGVDVASGGHRPDAQGSGSGAGSAPHDEWRELWGR